MREISIAVVAFCLMMVGCDKSETRQTNAKEYLNNLRIHVQPTSTTAVNGIVEPKFTLTITNTGGKTIRRIRIVAEVALGNSYSDTVVKVLSEKIEKDGGQLKVHFDFEKSGKMSNAQILMNQMKYKFSVTELGF